MKIKFTHQNQNVHLLIPDLSFNDSLMISEIQRKVATTLIKLKSASKQLEYNVEGWVHIREYSKGFYPVTFNEGIDTVLISWNTESKRFPEGCRSEVKKCLEQARTKIKNSKAESSAIRSPFAVFYVK